MEGEDLSEYVEWPSERVKPGGIFHPAKVTYSKETHELIKQFMEEQKLTMMQRNKIKYHLRNGDPLPLPMVERPKVRQIARGDEYQQAYDIIMRVKSSHKRPLNTIKASGAYEIPKYIPRINNKETSEMAKIRLQEIMSGIKHTDTRGLKIKNKYKFKLKNEEPEYVNPIDTLLQEIYERADWLAEMEELGEGKNHRTVIQGQIAERLREIKLLEFQQQQQYEAMKRLKAVLEKEQNVPPEGKKSEKTDIMTSRSNESNRSGISRTQSVERPASKLSIKSRAKSCISDRNSVRSIARNSIKSNNLGSLHGSVHDKAHNSNHGSVHPSIHHSVNGSTRSSICSINRAKNLGSIQGSNYENLHANEKENNKFKNV